MKKFFLFLTAICLAGSAAAGNGLEDDDVRQAVFGALDQAAQSLRNAPFGQQKIAVLPFPQGNSVLAGKLKNMLTQAGFDCVEGKEDPMWDQILKEIEWDERKSDILDQATLVKFGKLKAAQILLYGKIQVLDRSSERIFAMIELHATEIATKRHIWGGNFAYRFYKSKDVQGIIALDNGLRMLLKKNFDEAKKSLQSPAAAGKLNHIKSTAIIPLAGDIDGYMTGLAIEIFSETNHLPKIPDIPSLSQYRSFARDGKIDTDAVLFGSVRDLRRTPSVERNIPGRKIETTYDAYADIQLFLEDSRTGAICWSKTITLSGKVQTQRDMTKEEINRYRQEKLDNVPGDIKEELADNWKSYLKTAGIIIGCIGLFFGILLGIKAFFSYNNVR